MTEDAVDWPDAKWKQTLRQKLLAWFDQYRRDLPWRQTDDPYAIWISETMLQQTQVTTVIPYYHRFLEAFPSVQALAQAREEEVFRLWEGLGYYRRARHLHQAAQKIVAEHQGVFPRDLATLQSLPGIGRYTAGAILSIAFDQQAPILEANTIRVYSRLLGYDHDPRTSTGQKILWQAAEDWLPRKRVGTFNQAMMELGSLLCTPKDPNCEACPASRLCRAYQSGRQEEIPPPPKRPSIEEVAELAVVVCREEKVFLLRNDQRSRWAGMWDFVRIPLAENDDWDHLTRTEVEARTGMQATLGKQFATLKHGVTRFRITLHCVLAHWQLGEVQAKTDHQWMHPSQLQEIGLSVTARKIAQLLEAKAQQNRLF